MKISDEHFARSRMPHGTHKMRSANGVEGWRYSFKTELGDTFTMFAYFDSSYQVVVLEPVLEKHFRNPHIGHLYADGRICFGSAMNSGRRTLASAYAKSVLWANGISAMLHHERLYGTTPDFPFNSNY